MLRNTFLALALLAPAWPAFAQGDVPLDTDMKKFSYALGLQFGQNLQRQGLDRIDPAAFAVGIGDTLRGQAPRITAEQMQAAAQAIRESMVSAAAEKGQAALERGQAFLAENKDADGVMVTDSGLQYRVVQAGDGSQPTPEDRVTVHYRGKLLDGTEFDSSYRRNEPAQFGVTQVIAGWTEALQLMRPGSKYELWIPAELAYGSRGAGRAIGPNETLYFEVELIEVAPGS